VNGVTVQDDDVTNMIFSCAAIVKYISDFIALAPGDLIFTGTPSGVALEGGQKYSWLKAGDKVDIEIEGIGVLSNTMC
jgi:2-keto-4-pentenoate hydratase/2-oxohepta-3-ene-1,7-dioic acid hydratase in catechol pathway